MSKHSIDYWIIQIHVLETQFIMIGVGHYVLHGYMHLFIIAVKNTQEVSIVIRSHS